MSNVLRIGMIGCGEIANRATAPGIAAAANARLEMAMDVREEIAADMGQQYDVAHTTDVDELLGNPYVDAVYIATPHYLHAPLAIRALEAGKHVLVEKPIATTLEDADAMLAKARETGRKLYVAYTAQVSDAMVQLRDWIAQGMLGRVTGLRIVYRSDKDPSYWHGGFTLRVHDEWRKYWRSAGGGPLIMNTVHDLNTMRFLTGLEAARVYAEYDTLTTAGIEVEDFITLIIRYRNGAIGSLEAGCTLPGRDPLSAANRIYGEAGQVLLAGDSARIFLRQPWGKIPGGEWWDMPADEPAPAPRKTMIEKFARSMLEDVDLPASGWDGRQALEIIVAAYQSGKTHQAVDLPLLMPDPKE
jgi:UDP-N-acetylglucosamine 3-dehydrogenase